jgi:hypothetical protein
VIDPNADPLGRPAVELQRRRDGYEVDIPPVVLVHRYYYTGDRSFQAQLLPGGPSIIVVHHPKTGDRLYVDAQMMPGAPRVTYTGRWIDYDYGDHGMRLLFFGRRAPFVKYRNGKQWHRKLGEVVHAEELRACAQKAKVRTAGACQQTKTMTVGVVANVSEVTKTVFLPVLNVVRVLPVGRQLVNGKVAENLTVSAAEFKRERGIKRAEKQASLNSLSLPTVR